MEKIPSFKGNKTEASSAIGEEISNVLNRLDKGVLELGRMEEEGVELPEGIEDEVLTLRDKLEVVAKYATYAAALFQVSLFIEPRIESGTAITEEVSADGSVINHHSDKETEHILNYLGGREPISGEDRITFARLLVSGQYALLQAMKHGHFTQEDTAKYEASLPKTVPELQAMLGELLAEQDRIDEEQLQKIGYHTVFYSTPEPTASERAREKIEAILEPLKTGSDKNLASNLWRLEKKVGAPKIRWMTADSAEGKSQEYADGRSFYKPASNTIYLVPIVSEARNNYVSETAHAYQNSNYPVWMWTAGMKDRINTLRRAFTTGTSTYKAQEQEYVETNSVEHDAHMIVEPKLRKEIFGTDKEEEY